MSDAPQNPDPNRPLSEIGHLFLSSIRDRQTNGAARPVRKGPNGPSVPPIDPKVSIDLTPEEFARAYGGGAPTSPEEKKPQVTAVIAAHLNGRQIDRSREYAAHLAATHGRVGLIEVDASEFRLMLFERHADGNAIESADATITTPEKLDPRRMHEALEELSWDVDRWLLLLPNPRTPEARELLKFIDHWTLLATCDHDGVVSCYRTLKGLCGDDKSAANRPEMSLALLDVRSLDEADRVMLKLAGVCEQFLHCKLENEAVVKAAPQVSDHLVLCCRAGRENIGQPQFGVVREFITRSAPKLEEQFEKEVEMPQPISQPTPASPAVLPVMRSVADAEAVIAALKSSAPAPAAVEAINDSSEVVELIGDDANPAAVVSAFVRGRGGLAETQVKAPSCPNASLAVGRDRKLVLVAVARQGLCDLRDIANAYRWLTENRPLIAMALPQFSIEPTHAPRLQLLVDQSDVRADVLQPLLQSANVSVQTYRKLRWGGKTGLLLEAA